MKKVTDFLQSRPRDGKTSFEILGVTFKDVMNLPIEYLELTGAAKQLFVENPVNISSTIKKSLKTIGDLVNFGFDNVEYYLMTKLNKGIIYERELYKIQAALAKFSLKLFGTDFSVYDIQVDDLNVTESALKFLKKRNVEELSQLAINEEFYLSKFKPDENREEIIASVEAAMREFGVKTKHLLKTSASAKEVQFENDQTKMKKSPFFPKIVASIEKYRTFIEEQRGKNEQGAKGSLRTPDGIINTPVIAPIDFSSKDFDYTKLIKLVNSHYTKLEEFLADSKISPTRFARILAGKYLDQFTLSSLTTLFNCQIKDILTKNPVKVISTANEDGYIYDYSKLVQELLTNYGTLYNFREKTGSSADTTTRLTNGKPLRTETIKKLCELVGCKPKEVVYISKQPEPAATSEQDIPDVDYSTLKLILKQKFITLYDLCTILHLNYDTISLRISRGKYLDPGNLNAIANYLSMDPTDLVKINRTIGEVQKTTNLNKRRIPPSFNYEKLMLRIQRFYPNLDLESFSRKIKLKKNTVMRIERGWPIAEKEMEKISKNLFCSPIEICTPINGSSQKVFEERTFEYDYINLLKKINDAYDSLKDFKAKNKISTSTMKKIVDNQPISYVTLAKLMNLFNCELDEIVVLRDPQLRLSLISKIKAYQVDRDEENSQVDYSKFFKILKERKISKLEFLDGAKVSSMVWEHMTLNRQLSITSIRKICDYLHCSISDFCEEKNSKIFKELPSFENSICDYTGLYKLLNENLMTISTLLARANIPKNYTSRIKLGFELNDDYISRICNVLGCKKEDIVVYHPENSLKFSAMLKTLRERKQRVKPVHADKLTASQIPSESDETKTDLPQEAQNPTIDSQSGAEKLTSNKGKKPKFYFDEKGRGYLNLSLGRVRMHFENSHLDDYSFE